MQGPLYPSKIILVQMASTQIITKVHKRFFHLDTPTKYQYMTSITMLIPMGRFFDSMHSPIYQSNIGDNHSNL